MNQYYQYLIDCYYISIDLLKENNYSYIIFNTKKSQKFYLEYASNVHFGNHFCSK